MFGRSGEFHARCVAASLPGVVFVADEDGARAVVFMDFKCAEAVVIVWGVGIDDVPDGRFWRFGWTDCDGDGFHKRDLVFGASDFTAQFFRGEIVNRVNRDIDGLAFMIDSFGKPADVAQFFGSGLNAHGNRAFL